MDVLAKAMVVIILQHTSVSSQHAVQLKFIQCYLSIISQ